MTNESLTSTPKKRLPDSWVVKIFSTMQGHYGTRWLNMWRIGQSLPDGQDAGVVNAINHWAEKLGGYIDHPQTIKKVLENLPPEPPSLPQFAEMLRHSHVPPDVPMLESKISDEERERNKPKIREMLASLREPYADYKKGDGKDWARTIVQTPLNIDGKPRSQEAIAMAKKVLHDLGEDA